MLRRILAVSTLGCACGGEGGSHDAGDDGSADTSSGSIGVATSSGSDGPRTTGTADGTTAAIDGPPTIVSFTVQGSTAPAPVVVLGTLVIEAEVVDDGAVAMVELRDGPDVLASFTAPPYRYEALLDSSDNHVHTYRLHAVDDAGNTADAEPIDLTILLPDGGTTVWSQPLTLDDSDETVAALVVTGDDGIVVLGDRTVMPAPTTALVRKLEPDGASVIGSWQRDGAGASTGTALARASDDSLLVLGTETTATDDIWWQRLDAELAPQWAGVHDGGAGDDLGRAAEIDGAGNGYVVGYETSMDEGLRLWAAQLDSTGAQTWTIADPGGAGSDLFAYGSAIAEGELVIAGLRGPGEAAPWVRRLDGQGATRWDRPPPGTSEPGTIAYDVAALPEGDVVATGYVSADPEHAQIWIRRFDPAGETRWTRAIDPSTNTAFAIGYAVGITRGGEVAVVGTTTAATRDAWIGVVDATDGTLRWETARDLEAGFDEEARAVGFDSLGRLIVGATVHAGSDHAWLISLSP